MGSGDIVFFITVGVFVLYYSIPQYELFGLGGILQWKLFALGDYCHARLLSWKIILCCVLRGCFSAECSFILLLTYRYKYHFC